MRIYVVVEGESEKELFAHWIPFINPALKQVQYLKDLGQDSFYLVCGFGYPNYFEVIEGAVEDVADSHVNGHQPIDRLVICVDSEDFTEDEKRSEIEGELIKFLARYPSLTFHVEVVIQHFCLEAWALGNRSVISKNSSSTRLKRYLAHYDVSELDPAELLPPEDSSLNRANYATSYLRAVVNSKNPRLSYSKGRGGSLFLQNRKYFGSLQRRYEETEHISSFAAFLQAFS